MTIDIRNSNTSDSKPTVFIGSSSEAIDAANKLAMLMTEDFRPRVWRDVFQSGEYTFETLEREVGEADAAVFIFAKDDEVGFRGEPMEAARDNVVLEYGLFVSVMGRDRVLILEEKDVKIPSDLLGITIDEFPSDPVARQAWFRDFVNRAKTKWQTRRQRSESDAGLGFTKTLHSERTKLEEISESLSTFESDGRTLRSEPIELAATAPIRAYSEALSKVQHRFWTTTFLSSGFWTRPHGRVLNANRDMLERVRQGGGQARRLFLLDQPQAQVVQAYRDHRVLQRQLDKQDELERLADEHRNLMNNMRTLLDQGFDAGAVFDGERLWKTILPKDIVWDPKDSELAIYDDFRLDIFEGGSRGLVHAVRTHSRASRYFSTYLEAATQYFERLWDHAIPLTDLMDDLQEAVDLSEAKIDYESNWLAIYEYALGEDDQRLKTVELARVDEVLREEAERGLQVRSLLDVGTCTGRYPIQLRQHVSDEGVILGIDEDYDCVRFAQANVKRECPDEQRIAIQQCDFAAREVDIPEGIDVITCMLGTLSHFGWDAKPSLEDSLQRALNRMRQMLAPDGLLFLGTWSDYARKNGNLLGIYRQHDRDRLCSWTTSLSELDDRLAQAGLEVVGRASPELRLDVTWCRAGSP